MAGNDAAVVANPSDRTNIFTCKLSRAIDPFGNRIEYTYERDTCQEKPHPWETCEQRPHHWNQQYLQHIRYVDYPVEEATQSWSPSRSTTQTARIPSR
jgi:hypothetical protein